MIVHDMRTPLQALTLCTDLLRSDSESVLTQEDRSTLDMMMSYVRKLDVMTRSILDVGRMEEGRMPLRKATNPVVVVAREAVNFVTPIAGDKIVRVHAADQTVSNSFDHDIIHRVLVNLLVNAIKYSPARGEIVVEIEKRGCDTHVGVSDQGPGVPAEFSSKIFEKFESINNNTHHRKDSTGVGLAFCQMAVARHGGQIGVRSRDGGGSTFWFTLPDLSPIAVPMERREPVTA
jgi:K+-sensing histidine kinase KdpD